jgi:hypothetical protein
MTPEISFEGTSIRAVVFCPGGGACVMTGFPGLEIAVDGVAYMDPITLNATLQQLTELGVASQLIFTEEGELPPAAFQTLNARALWHGISLDFLPIEDFSVPSELTLGRWKALRGEVHARLDRGGTVALTCQYGAGRSGLMIAMILIERGVAGPEAVRQVREAFEEAIENEAQEKWLLDYARDPMRH